MSHALQTPRRCHVNVRALAGGADISQHASRSETSAHLSHVLGQDVDGREKTPKNHEVDFLKAVFLRSSIGVAAELDSKLRCQTSSIEKC